MSYIKVQLPERYELKQRIQSDKDKWIPFYARHGAYIGSAESIDYLKNEIKKYYDSKEN
jgi:hypothetical protein|tara:strand:+ start:64 stop:240 length:177 start_codon:yes stop_codon:yes gene_type:complete